MNTTEHTESPDPKPLAKRTCLMGGCTVVFWLRREDKLFCGSRCRNKWWKENGGVGTGVHRGWKERNKA